jgi:hypothetical protein
MNAYKISNALHHMFIITIKTKVKCRFRAAAMLFKIIQKDYINKSSTLVEGVVPQNVSTLQSVALVSLQTSQILM